MYFPCHKHFQNLGNAYASRQTSILVQPSLGAWKNSTSKQQSSFFTSLCQPYRFDYRFSCVTTGTELNLRANSNGYRGRVNISPIRLLVTLQSFSHSCSVQPVSIQHHSILDPYTVSPGLHTNVECLIWTEPGVD